MAYDFKARAGVRALAVGLAAGAAVSLAFGGLYAAGSSARAGDAAQARTLANLKPALSTTPVSTSISAQQPAHATAYVLTQPTPLRPVRFTAPVGARDLECLADAVYYEARGENAEGQAAIAQVVLNRTHHAGFPKSICGVVFQGASADSCQFSFACNGLMGRPKEGAAWGRAKVVAQRALSGAVMPAVGGATHFHVAGLHPGWGPNLTRVGQIGLHVFYAFSGRAARSTDDRPHAVYASMIPVPAAPSVVEQSQAAPNAEAASVAVPTAAVAPTPKMEAASAPTPAKPSEALSPS